MRNYRTSDAPRSVRFNAEHWAMVIAFALMATSCGACGSSFWVSYNHGRAAAYSACVAHHVPDDCGGSLW